MLFRLALFAVLLLSAPLSVLAADTAEADLSGLTESGISISIFSQLSPLQINQIHSWMIELRDSDNAPLGNATLSVVGGMPEHDHGLPTQPQITAEPQTGVYLLEGVRFHMPGKWQLIISIQTGDRQHRAVIDFQL